MKPNADWRRTGQPPARTSCPEPRAELLAQLNNFRIILLLLGAAGVAALLSHWLDAQVILLVVLVNVILGFVQEGRAEKALAAIRELLSPQAAVFRGGRRDRHPCRADRAR